MKFKVGDKVSFVDSIGRPQKGVIIESYKNGNNPAHIVEYVQDGATYKHLVFDKLIKDGK